MDGKFVVSIEQNVPLVQEPEKISGIFRGRFGQSLWQHRLPQAGEFGGGVVANPLDHGGRAFGENDACFEGVGAGWAGVEFSEAFKDGQVFSFQGAAYRRDEDGRMLAGMAADHAQRGEQTGGNIFRGYCTGNLSTPHLGIHRLKAARRHCPFRFRAVINPSIFVAALDAPAHLLFHGFHPSGNSFIAAFRANSGCINLEWHVVKSLTVQPAQVRLIGMMVRRTQPDTGHPAAGHRLKPPTRRIHFNGFLFNQLLAQIRPPQVTHRFLSRQK